MAAKATEDAASIASLTSQLAEAMEQHRLAAGALEASYKEVCV